MCAVKHSGGIDGNAALTSAAAVVLIVLLLAEGVTILDMGGLRTPHMFIGLVLIPPVLVKLGSTGYRFARYYLRTSAYRDKGRPLTALRLMAPVLVLSTIGVFASGVLLLVLNHGSGTLLEQRVTDPQGLLHRVGSRLRDPRPSAPARDGAVAALRLDRARGA